MPASSLTIQHLRQLSTVVKHPTEKLTPKTPGAELLVDLVREELRESMREALPDKPIELEKNIADLPSSEILSHSREALTKSVVENITLSEAQRKAVLDQLLPIKTDDQAVPVSNDKERSPEQPAMSNRTGFDVAEFSEVMQALQRAEVVEIGRLAKLNASATQAVLQVAPSYAQLNNQQLDVLVADQKLKPADAVRLGMVASLVQLVDDDLPIADTLLETKFTELGRKPQKLVDFLHVTPDALVTAMLNKDGELSIDKENAVAVVETLRRRIEELIPQQALVISLSLPPSSDLQRQLQAVRRVLERTPDILTKTTLDDTDVDATLRDALSTVRRVVSSYPALALDTIILSDLSPAAQVKEIQQRVGEFVHFSQSNASLDLLRLDLTAGSQDVTALDFSGLNASAQTRILAGLRAQARVFDIAGSVANTVALLQGGYHSALALADAEPELLSVRLQIPLEDARTLIERGRDRQLEVGHVVTTLLDDLRWFDGARNWLSFPEDVSDGLRQLPGYQSLLGQMSGCECKACDSVLSPAAYFVDLMSFVDRHVTAKVFTGTRTDHALKLSLRRPDLWTLPLNCDTTHDLLPTLEIINEILENAVATRVGGVSDYSNRTLVHRAVYETRLPTARESFVTPFDLRVAMADLLLQGLGAGRIDMVELMRPNAPVNERISAALSLSLPELDMAVRPRTDWTFLQQLYRLPLTRTGTVVNAFDVQDLMRGMEIERDALGALIDSRFVSGTGAPALRIRAVKRDTSDVQNTIERVEGMTQDRLDRLHRMFRAQRSLGWDTPSLDVVLEHFGGVLNSAVLARMVELDRLAKRLALPLDEALSLQGPIPEQAMAGHRESLVDRLFNHNILQTQTRLPSASLRFVHPALRDVPSLPETGPDASVFIMQRLQVACGVNTQELRDLIIALASLLGIDPNAPAEADRGFLLSAENLSALYRHALLAKRLGLSFTALFMLIRLSTRAAAVTTGTQLTQVLALHAKLPNMPWPLAVMAALYGDEQGDTPFIVPADLAEQLSRDILHEEALAFAPTLFAFLDGISEDHSRAIIAANAELFDAMPRDMLRLRAEVALHVPLRAPAGGFPAGVTASQLSDVLDAYNIRQIWPARLATELALAPDHLHAIARLLDLDLTATPVLTAFFGGSHNALRTTLNRLRRPLVLFGVAGLDALDVQFIADHPALFALGNLAAPIALSSLTTLAIYIDRRRALGAEGVNALHSTLLAYDAADGLAAAPVSDLAYTLGIEASSVRLLLAGARLPNGALAALDRMVQMVNYTRDHAIGIESLVLLAQADPVALAQGTQSLLADEHLRNAGAAALSQQDDSWSDALRSRRRTALADHMVRQSSGRFQSRADLYHYYLIDPDMEGCARTSRVVAAIGSVQTYVHRVLLNLEQDRRSPSHAQHVHVSPSQIPAGEWEWRKNYRVWEANRKVFLWPENYMLGSLRDDKTPQFEQLEHTLLQRDISEQAVLEAYAEYMQGFEDVANLRIAGAHHEISSSTETDVLHIFGCTAEDPPIYYYWTIENHHYSQLRADRKVRYSARRKINVTINAREVSANIVNSRLHLFWSDVSTQPNNRIHDGSSDFIGYRHNFNVNYSALRLDGSWTAPQSLRLNGNGAIMRDGGRVVESRRRELIENNSLVHVDVPQYAHRFQERLEYDEAYTLQAPTALKPVCDVINGTVYFNLGPDQPLYVVDLFSRDAQLLSTSEATIARLHRWWFGGRNEHLFHLNDVNGQQLYLLNPNNILSLQSSELRSLPPVRLSTPVSLAEFMKSATALQRNIMGSGAVPGRNWVPERFNLRHAGYTPDNPGTPVASLQRSGVHLIIPTATEKRSAMIMQSGSDAYVLGSNAEPRGDGWFDHLWWRPYRAQRIGTTIAGNLSHRLFYGGVQGLLAKAYQQSLREAEHWVRDEHSSLRVLGTTAGLDFTGPMGIYYREIFYHIPMLLAEHLNARGDHAAAQNWLATVFDPTAPFPAGTELNGMTDAQRLAAERNRVWQYAEFSSLTPPRLRDVLTQQNAQAAYRNDPFNPFAIARLRRSAFQKNTVMHYVGNLLDNADALFSQFTRETVDEAHILYDLALQILGPRPARAGSCGEGAVQPRTYAHLQPHMQAGQEFLVEVETFVAGRVSGHRHAELGQVDFTAGRDYLSERYMPVERLEITALDGRIGLAVGNQAHRSGLYQSMSHSVVAESASMTAEAASVLRESSLTALNTAQNQHHNLPIEGGLGRQMTWSKTSNTFGDRIGRSTLGMLDIGWQGSQGYRPDDFVLSFTRQVSSAFCIPHNRDLLALWDRAEDRLEKIRTCRNINGERIELALFAPEIDPMALVRAKAAGLSLGDILASVSGNLPPYRFNFLLAKARDYAGLVQSFGARLQSAIERRDAEEMALLRANQAADMQRLITKVREREVKLAETALAEAQQRKESVDFTREYYQGKYDKGVSGAEAAYQTLGRTSTLLYLTANVLKGKGGILHLLPQIGAPTAMKYGGDELGNSAKTWGEVFSDTAKMTELMSKLAKMDVDLQKQFDGYKLKAKQGSNELKEMDKRIKAAEIRVEMAQHALKMHEQSIADHEEVLALFGSKFTSLDFYTWLTSEMQSLYRRAFNAALSMARLAERAYRFERPQDTAPLLDASLWNAARAGLGAGERLASSLIEMEKRYIETHYRALEVRQPFSIGQINPVALDALRNSGECSFDLPELIYDLFYPGQYRRRIRSVRVTISGAVGPHTNIPATLTLMGSKLRLHPNPEGVAGLTDSPLRHSVTIATSTAQADTGVLDFSFSDPRYIPFEGAGAVDSAWRLSLPQAFAAFDYQTISDVVLEISYSAEYDGALRDRVEAANATLQNALIDALRAP